MPTTTRQWNLVPRPKGLHLPTRSPTHRIAAPRSSRTARPSPASNSLHRPHHARLDGRHSPVHAARRLGEVMRAFGLAEIIESRHPDFNPATNSWASPACRITHPQFSDKTLLPEIPSIPFVSDINYLEHSRPQRRHRLLRPARNRQAQSRRNARRFRGRGRHRQHRRPNRQN